jgi:hypothetical protein
MPGFLSIYAGTERIYVTDTDEWWVDVKQVLLHNEMAIAQRQYTEGERDLAGYQREMVVHAITGWNLTDENEQPLPLHPLDVRRQVVAQLPQPVFLRLYERVSDLNSPRKPEDQRSFRNGSPG